MAAAQEVFEAFFGPGIFMSPAQRGQQRHQGGAQQGPSPYNFLVIIMIAVMFFGQFAQNPEPGFSFKPTLKLNVPRETATLHAKYYVGPDFDVAKAKNNWESYVEVYYVHHLSSECDYETTMMLKKIRKAKMTGDQARVEQAKAMPKTSCEKLEKIKKKHPRIYHSALSWH
jgi:hypothetical protein